MKFEAINTEGKKVIGIGVTLSNEDNVNGREIGYIFFDTVEWCDGSEFRGIDFDFIYFDTVKIVNE